MNIKTSLLWAAGAIIVATIVAIGADQLYGQAASQLTGDFRNAATAEVMDAQGQPLLRGSFVADGDTKGDIERKAKLAPVTSGSNASGEAEIEYNVDAPTTQEIEMSAKGLPAGTQVSLVIDGTTIATATADAKGKVDVEVIARAATQ